MRFGVFEVDLRAGELRKHGLHIRLQEQPFQVLAMLLEHGREVVTREELQKDSGPLTLLSISIRGSTKPSARFEMHWEIRPRTPASLRRSPAVATGFSPMSRLFRIGHRNGRLAIRLCRQTPALSPVQKLANLHEGRAVL